MKTILVFGTFDILHPGHLSFLKEARRKGDRLVVVITRDAQVLAQKGRKTYFKEKERLEMVKGIKGVDGAILGDKGKKWSVVLKVKPAVICIGYDQRADHPAFLWQLNGMRNPPEIVRLKALHPDRYASTKMRMEMRHVLDRKKS